MLEKADRVIFSDPSEPWTMMKTSTVARYVISSVEEPIKAFPGCPKHTHRILTIFFLFF